MKRRSIFVCLLSAAVLAPLAVRAEHTRYWRQSDFSQFQKGTATGVAIRSDGKIAPAPKFGSFADPNLAYLWALRLDSHSRLYAAGGSDAKVLRFDDSGKATTVFESNELAAQALAFDSKDNLYVGTSPDGKVYRVTPDGNKGVFFDPKTKYIWALAVDAQGALFVGTGDTGEVFVVTPDGKGQLFYQSQERHGRSLAFDSKGNLLIGTEPDGLILRVPIMRKSAGAVPEPGAPFVLYETDKAEVTSLLVDPAGNIYAASVGRKTRMTAAPRVIGNPAQQTSVAVSTSGGIVITQAEPSGAQTSTPYQFPAVSGAGGGSEVVEIAPDGSPETLWTSNDSSVFTMGMSAAGKVLLGTGDNGQIIELEDHGIYSNVAKTASAQVTGLVSGPAGKIFVATANPGKIFQMGPGYESNGTFESVTFDADIFSHWGRLTWWGENGAATGKVAFYVRSGNTSNPESNWSPWVGPFKSPAEETVDCPPARFVQWKAVFLDTVQGSAPDISWVNLAYQPKNVAPVIDDIAIQDPGIRVAGFGGQAGPASAASAQLRYPRTSGDNSGSQFTNADAPIRPIRIDIPAQGVEQKGYQSVLWSAHDDNDDDLVFAIYYRGENEQNWRLLKDKLTQRYYSWDTTSMPDGAYYLKIVASDSPSNPANQSLSADRESDRLEVANTPPRIENLRASFDGPNSAKASFDASSASSALARAQYSVDAGDWQTVFPVGLLSDAPRESYSIEIPGLPAGEHTIAVQITDRFANTTSAKVTFTVQTPGSQ